MDKNGQQFLIQRPKYTSKQTKNLYAPQFFFVVQCYIYRYMARTDIGFNEVHPTLLQSLVCP